MPEQERVEPGLEKDPRVVRVLDNLRFREGLSDKLLDAECAPRVGEDGHNPEFEVQMLYEQVRERFEALVLSAGSFEQLVQAVQAEAECTRDAASRTTWFEVLQQLGG